jgi:hypothetical protein
MAHDQKLKFDWAPERSGDAPDRLILAVHRGRERRVRRFNRERKMNGSNAYRRQPIQLGPVKTKNGRI